MNQRVQAKFPDATRAQQAVSRILESGGRDLDICASYDGVVRPPAPQATQWGPGLALAAGLSWFSSPRMSVSSVSGSPVAALAGSAALWLGRKLWQRTPQPEDPPEDCGDGTGRVAVLYPTGCLGREQIAAILRNHGGEVC